MAVEKVDSFWCSVSNVEEHLAIYHGFGGLKVLSDETWPADVVEKLFKLPSGTRARVVSIDGGLRRSKIKLVEFKPGSSRRIRPADAKPKDVVFHCLSLLVRSLAKTEKELGSKGYTFISAPQSYDAVFGFPCSEQPVIVADGVVLNHVERHTGEDALTDRDYLQLDHVGLQVRSQAEVRRFAEAVGLECRVPEKQAPKGVFDVVLALGPEDHFSVASWGVKGKEYTGLECDEHTPQGRALVGRPPDLGLFMVSLTLDSLAPALDRAKAAGFPVFSGPIRTGLVDMGTSAIVEGPSGLLVGLQDK